MDGKDDKGNALNQPHRTASLLETAKLPDEDRRSVLKTAQKSEADLTHALNDLVHIAEGKNPPPRKTADLFYGPEGVKLPELIQQGDGALENFKNQQNVERAARKEQGTGRINLKRDVTKARNQGGQWPDMTQIAPSPHPARPRQERLLDRVERNVDQAIVDAGKLTKATTGGLQDSKNRYDHKWQGFEASLVGISDEQFDEILRERAMIRRSEHNAARKATGEFFDDTFEFGEKAAGASAAGAGGSAIGAWRGRFAGLAGTIIGAILGGANGGYAGWKLTSEAQPIVSDISESYIVLREARQKQSINSNVPNLVTEKLVPMGGASVNFALKRLSEKYDWDADIVSSMQDSANALIRDPQFVNALHELVPESQSGDLDFRDSWRPIQKIADLAAKKLADEHDTFAPHLNEITDYIKNAFDLIEQLKDDNND